MKYVGNSFGAGMLSDPDVIEINKELDYDEFQALAYGAKSVISNEDLAKCLGLEYNPGRIIINPGDIYLYIYTVGGRLPDTFDDLDELSVELHFMCKQIIKK